MSGGARETRRGGEVEDRREGYVERECEGLHGMGLGQGIREFAHIPYLVIDLVKAFSSPLTSSAD